MNDNPEKKIEELKEIIASVLKDNKLLKFENDHLIKQNKLSSAIIDKLHQRIDNLTKLKELPVSLNIIPETDYEISLTKNESNHYSREKSQDHNDNNQEHNVNRQDHNDNNLDRNEIRHDHNDNKHERNDSSHERNDNSQVHNDNKLERNDNSQQRNDNSQQRNDNKHERNDNRHERNDNRQQRNDNRQDHNDNKHERNDNSQKRNDNRHERNDSSQERNDNSQQRNDNSQQRNDSSQASNEGSIVGKTIEKGHNDIMSSQYYNVRKILDKTSPLDSIEKLKKKIIRENLDNKFKKKFINKVKNRLTEEIYYFSSHEKVRVDALLKTIKISFPAIMRDFQLLRKYNWIEHVGPREGGHYVLSEDGRMLTESSESLTGN